MYKIIISKSFFLCCCFSSRLDGNFFRDSLLGFLWSYGFSLGRFLGFGFGSGRFLVWALLSAAYWSCTDWFHEMGTMKHEYDKLGAAVAQVKRYGATDQNGR